METLIESIQKGNIPSLIKSIAKEEQIPVKTLTEGVRTGRIVIPANNTRRLKQPCGIGQGLRVKINANLGTSTARSGLKNELKKLKTAVEFGADTVMDLSVGSNLHTIRRKILKNSPVPVGTVPVYEAVIAGEKKYGDFLKMKSADILEVIEAQAAGGVDFFTIHSGITKKTLRALREHKRLMGIVSRGGALLAKWIQVNKKENPLFEDFDKVLAICKKYDVTLSLGDGLRPGTLLDATDAAQIAELKVLGDLAKRARKKGVQVMIEGPGHVPLNQIKKNIELQKKYCGGAPFYVLGPLVTDIGVCYDHISAAIGSAFAAACGADFLCFVTPAEHLRLPENEDIKLGVIASKIAAHSADLARGNPQAWKQDESMSRARRKRDWETQITLSLDPEKTRRNRSLSQPEMADVCTMCGKFCSMKLMDKSKKKK